MASRTSDLAREVQTLRQRLERLEERVPSAPAPRSGPLPFLREHFVPRLAGIPSVLGAAVEEEDDGWRVWTFMSGWDRVDEKAVYAAERETLWAPGAVPVRFLLEPESTAEDFEAAIAEMIVIFRRQ